MDCLIDRPKVIDKPIKKNKLPFWNSEKAKSTRAGSIHEKCCGLICKILFYEGCQSRDGNLDEFFCRENQACTPSLSDTGKMRLCSKSVVYLEGIVEAKSDAPAVTLVVLDGSVIVQMLKPGTAETFQEYAH